jgi:pimeloyl-ACP methyl ester carboxylesterase
MAALRRNIPDCRLVELPTGHAVFRDEADRFMACLEDFWDR